MAPSIMQSLMREPSRSYQSIYADPSIRPLSPPGLRSAVSRPTSLRSSSSLRSVATDMTRRTSATTGATSREPAWTNGQWDWGTFGGRGGLTGGARSLYTPSVVGKSLGLDDKASKRKSRRPESVRSDMSTSRYDSGTDDPRNREGSDLGSAWSVRSGDSLRTSMSAPGFGPEGGFVASSRSRHKPQRLTSDASGGTSRSYSSRDASSRDQSGSYRSSSRTSRLVPGSSYLASVDAKQESTSRRYSTQPSSRPTSPPLSNVSTRSDSYRAPKLRHGVSSETTPSLTSSASSAPSSEPLTPVNLNGVDLPPALDGASRKKSRQPPSGLSQALSPEPVQACVEPIAPAVPVVTSRPELGEPVVAPSERNVASDSGEIASQPEVGRLYSVDEIFALAAPATVDGAADDSGMPAEEAEPEPTAVPRLRLTRTESDQSRLGARGSVELEVAEDDEEEVLAGGYTPPVEVESARYDAEALDAMPAAHERHAERRSMDTVREDPEEEEDPLAANRVSSGAAQETAPVLAQFVQAKRGAAKRSSSSSSIDSIASASSSRAQVSSSRAQASSPRTVATTDDRDQRPTSPVMSESSVYSAHSEATSTTTNPDWRDRVQALGEGSVEPIKQQHKRSPRSGRHAAPQRTVQQLRAQEGSSSGPRPSIGRPRSTRSLRQRGSRLEVMPEDVEAEAEASSSGGEMQGRNSLSKLRTDLPVSSSSSLRSSSPSPRLASPRWAPSRSSSSATSMSSQQELDRRARSLDIEREQLKPSPLARAISYTSSRPASVRSLGSTKSNKSWDYEAIAAGASSPRGLGKFFQPPLASSKASKPEPVVAVVNPPSRPAGRATSLRNVSLSSRRFYEEDEDDAQSLSGISIASAPQLSPMRPPRNPARLGDATIVKPIPAALLEPDLPARDRYSVSASSSPRAESPISGSPDQRALSSSFSTAERSVARERTAAVPPPVAAPILGVNAPPSADAAPESPAISRANSIAPSRPLSSHLAPSAVDFNLTSLALAPRTSVNKQKTSRRFGFFRRSSGQDSSANRRGFEPSLDLLYGTLDAAVFRKKLSSDEVLVEAVAVGVDRFDRERTWQLAKAAGGTGWVAGRSIVGNVLAVGDSVHRLKKGDLVWGLSPLKKSGGIASLVILPRDNVALAPSSLPMELAAALPAHATAAMLVMQSLCQTLPKGSKILVLEAHQGVGYLCLQLARHLRPGAAGTRDLWTVAQCPLHVREAENICREAGAMDVLRDDPLPVIQSIHEGSFDVVIDTVGGRRLYDASRRILHNSGSFITTVGDSLTDPNASSNDYQTSIRSLRRAFFKKDKKAVSYWRVDPDVDDREAVRTVLDKVRDVVDADALRPMLGKVLSLDNARRAFDPTEADEDGTVIRIKA